MTIKKTLRGYNVKLNNGFRLYDLQFKDLLKCIAQ